MANGKEEEFEITDDTDVRTVCGYCLARPATGDDGDGTPCCSECWTEADWEVMEQLAREHADLLVMRD